MPTKVCVDKRYQRRLPIGGDLLTESSRLHRRQGWRRKSILDGGLEMAEMARPGEHVLLNAGRVWKRGAREGGRKVWSKIVRSSEFVSEQLHSARPQLSFKLPQTMSCRIKANCSFYVEPKFQIHEWLNDCNCSKLLFWDGLFLITVNQNHHFNHGSLWGGRGRVSGK